MGHIATAVFVDRDEVADKEWNEVVRRAKTYSSIAMVSNTSIKNANFTAQGDLTMIEVPLYWSKNLEARAYSLEARGWKITWDTGYGAFFYGKKRDPKYWRETK